MVLILSTHTSKRKNLLFIRMIPIVLRRDFVLTMWNYIADRIDLFIHTNESKNTIIITPVDARPYKHKEMI